MKLPKKIKSLITGSTAAVTGGVQKVIKVILKRVESLTAVAAIFFIWVGTKGYDGRASLVIVGVILLADYWLDKFLKRKIK
ncbi:MAG: hypothetical protein PHY02_06380 [Phycisphaerae bacterium]|nr:hypothetical protein [Phycisphaerae bacterium]